MQLVPRALIIRTFARKRWVFVLVLAVLVLVIMTSVNRRMPQPRFPLTPGTEAIVFRSRRTGAFDIYVMRPDGTHETRLTDFRRRSPVWWVPSFLVPYSDLVTNQRPLPAPNGQGVVFISNVEGEDLLYQMRLDGTELHQIVSPLGRNTAAVLSPNGQWVAHVTIDQALVVVSRDGSQEQCLTCAGLGTASTPAWAPDSQHLVVPVNQAGQFGLYLVDVHGSDPVRLASTPSVIYTSPAWSPDGRQIAFGSDAEAGQFEIYVMNIDGSAQRRLTNIGAARDPAWSPDGQRLVFAASQNGEPAELYVINVDGSNLRQVTFNNASDSEPVWVRIGDAP
jgi:Tol biopolymer transport system component